MDIKLFWKSVLEQDREAIRGFFCDDAVIKWHCTNECFTVDEFIRANCEYPGEWDGETQRVEIIGNLIITVTRVFPKDRSCFFHTVSFIGTQNDKIISLDEYWSDDGDAPLWRQEMNIGKKISE